LRGHQRGAIDAAMRAIGHSLLGVTLAATTATAAFAQQNPGLSAQPAGRSLADPTATPEEKSVDLTRPQPGTQIKATSSEELFFDAAMRGEPWAQTQLGKIYVESTNDPERRQKGMELLRQAAAQKDAEAIRLLANIAAVGVVDQPSNVVALQKLKEAAELGSPEAQYELASIYAEGRGVHRDMNQALVWGRKAAQQGNVQAQFSVGRTLIESGNPAQRTEGMTYLQQAADGGSVNATLYWANVVGKGEHGVPKDEIRAEALLKPWAEKGNADCQFVLAALYKFGDSFAERREEAYQWMQRAADQGHSDALKILESEER
jgi:TPR repeat protein